MPPPQQLGEHNEVRAPKTLPAPCTRGKLDCKGVAQSPSGTLKRTQESERDPLRETDPNIRNILSRRQWCKETVFELALRIPFMIRDPSASPAAVGSTTRVFAENVRLTLRPGQRVFWM